MDTASTFDRQNIYGLESTSLHTWNFEPIVVRETSTTRLRVFAKKVVNQNDPEACISLALQYQRRARAEDEWTEPHALSRLKAGESVQFTLSTGESKDLIEEVNRLRVLAGQPLRRGYQALKVVDGDAEVFPADVVDALTGLLSEQNGHDLAARIVKAAPDLASGIAVQRRAQQRACALEEFRDQLREATWSEAEWEAFFRRHRWILSFGTLIHFVSEVREQPITRGPGLDGRGAARGDHLMATGGLAARYTVLVEVKTPRTRLVGEHPYRTRTFGPSSELSGAVAQVQRACLDLDRDARSSDDLRQLEFERGVHTYQPRGVLVVGDTRQLETVDQRQSFELHRRGMPNPEVITFDELYERTRMALDLDHAPED